GKLSDVHGRRPLFVVALAFLTGGSLVAALAPSLAVVVLGRAIQGLGAGGLTPLGLTVIGDMIAPRERGAWLAATGAVGVLGAVAGPLVGGLVTDQASWRLALVVAPPLAAAGVALVWFGFGNFGERHRRAVDYRGAALFA